MRGVGFFVFLLGVWRAGLCVGIKVEMGRRNEVNCVQPHVKNWDGICVAVGGVGARVSIVASERVCYCLAEKK
jgi:hypothetical protein